MRLKIIRLLYLLLCLLGGVATAAEYQFRHYDTNNGLSQNSVMSIVQDNMGFMWFGTNDGMNRFDGRSFKVYHKGNGANQLGSDRICVMYEAPNHELWVGTDHGVYIYSPTTDSFRRFSTKTAAGESIERQVNVITGDAQRVLIGCNNEGIYIYDLQKGKLQHHKLEGYPAVSSLYMDSDHTIWIGFYESGLSFTRNLFKTIVSFTGVNGRNILEHQTIMGMTSTEQGRFFICSSASGLSELNIPEKRLIPLISSVDGKELYARDLIKNDDQLLMATESGLFAFNMSSNSYTHYKYEATNPFSLSDNSLQKVFRDKDGGIWVGSYFGGVCYAPRMAYAFNNYMPRVDVEGSLHGRRVGQMVEAANGHILVATEDGGLNRLDPATGRFEHLAASVAFPNVQSLCLVGNEVWAGTLNNGLKVMDVNTGRLLRSYESSSEDGHLHDNFILTLEKARQSNNVYVGTLGGVYCYDPAQDRFNHLKELPQQIVKDIMEDRRHNLWVAIYDCGVFLRKAGSKQWQHFREADGTLASNNVVGLCETAHGDIWVYTDCNGASLFDKKKRRFEHVPIPSFCSQRMVQSMVEDRMGQLWLTTNEGLMCYNPDDRSTRIYSTVNGLLDNNFSGNSSLCSSKGQIYLGCQSGLVAFSPESFLGVSSAPVIIATELMLQGSVVDNFTPESPLTESITVTRELTLNHDQNAFSLKISVLSYRDAQMRQIAYYLEGFDHEWQNLYSDNYIRYTNLPPGNYVLHVQDMSNIGKTAEPYTLRITVLRPWYQRWWAWLLYLLLMTGVGLLVYRYLKERSRMNRQLAMEKFEHEKQQELYQSKISFFTNVAHEIRTPLTLIKGPLTDILQKDIDDDDERENLHIMDQNVTRLLDLTNQLLDFRKIERDGLRLNFQHCNIGQVVKDVYKRFRPLMQQRGIADNIILPETPLMAWVDREALTKIVSNLLTNATKYCEQQVCVEVTAREEQVEITTRNDGRLIDAQMRQQIFKPFFRADNVEAKTGTGIGLALARSLAELHGGKLEIIDDDTLNVFRLTLPIEQQDYVMRLDEETVIADTTTAEADEQTGQEQLPTVLIVEDNAALLAHEKNHLQRHYRVLTATDGEQALKVLTDHDVDIIVSDVMMEPMDGFELCQHVKGDVNFSHVPVILLTALTLDSAKIQGMESGADSYIEKPFSMDYLLSVIQNLLRSRQSIKQAYATSPFLQQDTVSISKADEAFMQRLEKVMTDHVKDSDFDINALASEMCMSRTNLNRKMRGLFNLTPNNYIKVERLKRAAQLLKQGETKINEVCYMVGFNSPSYFTQCFQKQFGMLPKEFVNQKNVQE